MNKSLLVFFFVLFFGLIANGCSSFLPQNSGRFLASDEFSEINRDLLKSTNYMNKLLRSKSFTASNCSAVLGEVSKNLFGKDFSEFLQDMTRDEVVQVNKSLFEMRLNLRLRLKLFYQKNELSRECAKMAKSHMAIFRNIEDSLQNKFLSKEKSKNGLLQGNAPWLEINKSKLQNFVALQDFKSGDLIMWRSHHDLTALYSKFGREHNTFTHISIVHQDSASGELYIISSEIGHGLYVRKMTEFLTTRPMRVAILRYHDDKIAELASSKIYEETKKKSKKENQYNFYFNDMSPREYSNAEVISFAFFEASDGEIDLPLFKTSFDLKNREFLTGLGIEGEEGLQPSDFDIDPRFDLLVEWRNSHPSEEDVIKNEVWTAILKWMEKDHYVFAGISVEGQVKFLLNQFPFLHKMGRHELSDKLSRGQLSVMMSFEEVAQVLIKEVKKQKSRNYQQVIEKVREQDLKDYLLQKEKNRRGEAYPNPLFHHFFRAIN